MSTKAWTESAGDTVPSTAALHGHPVHPMIVPFPIAFLVGALVTDIVYMALDEPFWASASYWLLWAGIVTALVAAVFGLMDFLGDRRVRNLNVARLHFGGNAVVIVIAIVNVSLRMNDGAADAYPVGLVLSAVTAAILVFTGWLGGELAYRHRVGVMARGAMIDDSGAGAAEARRMRDAR